MECKQVSANFTITVETTTLAGVHQGDSQGTKKNSQNSESKVLKKGRIQNLKNQEFRIPNMTLDKESHLLNCQDWWFPGSSSSRHLSVTAVFVILASVALLLLLILLVHIILQRSSSHYSRIIVCVE